MATEWYLMNTNYDTVSGYESEDFENFAPDAFNEALNSSLGSDIEVCNFDLSVRVKTRVIVQGNMQDTRLKTMQRSILAPIGTCKSGQYIFYKNRYWLIIGLVDDNRMYEKAIAIICNYLLTWKNGNGSIIQRWVNVSSASQYNNGETSNKFYFVRSDQIMILTPDDDECLLIKHKQRFIIDRRCSTYEKNFSDDITMDTSKKLITYELTRIDNVLFDYQDSGHSEFMAYQDEQHKEDGYYKIDGKGFWLCDIPSENINDKNTVLLSRIECDEPVIYCGIDQTVFYAKFFDSDGNTVSITPQWKIDCEFVDNLDVEYADNAISISVNNNKLINKSFELSLCSEGYEKTTIVVTIKAFI